MRILVCNDDGIFAPGIINLATCLKELGEVTVVAPDMERSATGHAITMHSPLRINKVSLPNLDIDAYSVSGTPADCVKIGVDVLLNQKPDIVFSGINRGQNLGTDILYSGTVSAAIEGAILGLPSAAISLTSYENLDYSFAGEVAKCIAEKIIHNMPDAGTLLNINVPSIPKEQCKGIRITKMGIRKYKDNYIKRLDPRGRTYYWLAGEPVDEDQPDDTDISAVHNGFVSVTPIHFDLTNYLEISSVKDWLEPIHKDLWGEQNGR